jgi:WD40 repeat protein
MKLLFNLGFILFMGVLSSRSAFSNNTITLLDRGELYPSMVADNQVFWIGHSRKNFVSDYHLEAYTSQGSLIDRVPLTHSLMSVKKTGAGAILITGINANSGLSEYTVASLKKGKIHLKTSKMSANGLINFWIGTLGKRLFFADMGGNPDDNTSDMQAPAQTLFFSTGSEATFLSTRLRMPIAGTVLNGKLLLISRDSMKTDSSSIVEVDPTTAQKRVLLASKSASFRGIEVIPGTSDIITSAAQENKLVIFDTLNGKTKREIPTKGFTRSFALTGHCVIAGNDQTNTIELFDLASKENKSILTESVKMAASEFSGIKQIAVDEATGTVFARANLPCNPLLEKCTEDKNRVVSFDSTVADTIRSHCHSTL